MLIGGRQITLGADPEVFLEIGGKKINAYGMIEGTKEKPFPVEQGAVQVDGMALEFNIDPASNLGAFTDNICKVMNTLRSMVPNYDLSEDCTFNMTEGFLDSQPEASKELGCSADFNAYSMQETLPPNSIMPMRTAGGHIHMGGIHTNTPNSEEHLNLCGQISRAMDRELGVYSLLWDKDQERRRLYGAPGAFRPKTYGLEYRTLSNKWIFSEKLMSIVYDFTGDALKSVFEKGEFIPPDDYEAADMIHGGDENLSFFQNNPKAERVKEALCL